MSILIQVTITPISLLPVISKVFECFINMLIAPHFTAHLLIHSTLLVMRLEFHWTMISTIENVLKWRHDWLVTFNAKKTKLLSLPHSRNRSFRSVQMGSSTQTE